MQQCFAEFEFFQIVDEEHREQFAEELEALLTKTPFPHSTPFPDAVDCLISLKNKGFLLGMATSRVDPPEVLAEQLAHTGFVELFSSIATRASISAHWSDKTAQLKEVCRALEIQTEQSILVSDIPSDILGAKEIGCCHTVAMTTGGTRPEVLAQAEPDLLLRSLAQLSACVLKV